LQQGDVVHNTLEVRMGRGIATHSNDKGLTSVRVYIGRCFAKKLYVVSRCHGVIISNRDK
jgi:hypothetical protein